MHACTMLHVDIYTHTIRLTLLLRNKPHLIVSVMTILVCSESAGIVKEMMKLRFMHLYTSHTMSYKLNLTKLPYTHRHGHTHKV